MVSKFNSRIVVDWLSYAAKRDTDRDQSTGDLMNEVMGLVATNPEVLLLMDVWELSSGRFPYSKCFSNSSNTCHIYFGHEQPHLLIEISGQGCAALGKKLFNTIMGVEQLITRIDVAVDVECENSPKEILDSLPEGRWRSTGHIISDTGETVYIGSQKSDRFARVYRYNAPHPRAHYLRYEMVYRRQQAKEIAKSINIVGLKGTAAAAGNSFAWSHGTWFLRSEDSIKAYRPERNKAKTERWFYKQVVPAISRMLREGILTEQELKKALGLTE